MTSAAPVLCELCSRPLFDDRLRIGVCEDCVDRNRRRRNANGAESVYDDEQERTRRDIPRGYA